MYLPGRSLFSAALLLSCIIQAVYSFSSANNGNNVRPSLHQQLLPPRLTISNVKSHTSLLQTVRRPSSSSLSAVEGDFDPDAINRSVTEIQSGSLKARIRALYKFTRPHTIRGTILASIAGTVRALVDTPGAIANADWGFMLPRAAIGMVALLLGNAFIVGINQIFDRDIDVMNKPFLPVASGEMSVGVAWGTVLFSGIVGPGIV